MWAAEVHLQGSPDQRLAPGASAEFSAHQATIPASLQVSGLQQPFQPRLSEEPPTLTTPALPCASGAAFPFSSLALAAVRALFFPLMPMASSQSQPCCAFSTAECSHRHQLNKLPAH